MPGFVDVSNMSAREIRLMDHAADYDDVDYQPRRRLNRRPDTLPEIGYSVSDVWAAAWAANRINGGYFKEPVYAGDANGQPQLVKRRNRDVMMEILLNPTDLTVDDIERGEHCRRFLESDLTFRTLKGRTGEFDTAVKKVLAVKDRFYSVSHRYEFAIVACLPASVERTEARNESESRIQFARGGLIGAVGDKVDLNVEVVSAVFSKNYGIYWIRAITDQDQPVFFSNKETFDVGTHVTVRGTVKAHRDNLTQLNRVKVL